MGCSTNRRKVSKFVNAASATNPGEFRLQHERKNSFLIELGPPREGY